ncbi:hypothetical protein ACFRMQ_36310 [Kitasatospora sp. NPDC056783]|uniref:T4 family baseplate hub assembly chaperone n=1 Tax=Kitasatospora sp. NPDC056783 TaxID=3345943 RepID=UPI00367E6C0F
MERLSAVALLATWESGLTASRTGRALLLHAAARPAEDRAALLAVPVGERDAELFELRVALFGERLDVLITCGNCAEEMEFDFAAAQVVGAARPADGPLVVAADGWQVSFRLPTTGDLAAVERLPAAEARAALLAECVLEASRAGGPAAADQLPEELRQRMAEAAAEADPCADIRLNVACPQCGDRTKAGLDIVSHLWDELDAWARGTLLDVHVLATAYGWSEPEILALSPLRRRYYLELCADA